MVALIDYGVGNLFSLRSSFAAIGEAAEVTSSPEEIRRADRVILPGVGAFADAAARLAESGLDEAVREAVRAGKPVMGICLGMQLLFDRSLEYGEHPGLGLLRGEIRPIAERIGPGLKIPQMGWNALIFKRPDCPLFRRIREGEHVYFVHSYSAVGCGDSLAATAEYGVPLTAAVQRGHVFGTQFHPEKSGNTGLKILKEFCAI